MALHTRRGLHCPSVRGVTFRYSQDTLDSRGGVGGKLPFEIIERVLSFLPVPVLCRMRLVCRAWNELMSRPSFHDLCDRNGKSNVYLFLWRDDYSAYRGSDVPPIFTGTFRFLDLDAMRWYSIQASEVPRFCACGNEIESRYMAMDDGLICELTSSQGTDKNFALTLSDPVAKARRILPTPPNFYSTDDAKPHIVTVVDGVTHSYKVFLLNNRCQSRRRKAEPRAYVHEPFTNIWRGMKNFPDDVKELWASSAVSLHQTVFVVDLIHRDYDFDQLRLLSHDIQGDSWAEVWRMGFRRTLDDPQLVVSDNRLFVIVRLDPAHYKLRPVPSSRSCPNSESLFQTNQDYPRELFEMYEILIAENSRKPVVQYTHAQLRQIFGSRDTDIDLAYGYPCFDSNGMCNSVVLVSRYTGQIRRYYLATGSVDVLPSHPSVQTSEELPPVLDDEDTNLYNARTMKLSLRNLLARRPTNSSGWRLLQ